MVMAKTPKTLNPADKARRDARKRELKKNKIQRQLVRSKIVGKEERVKDVNVTYVTPLTLGVKPPGCPPGMPPDLKLLAEDSSKVGVPAPYKGPSQPKTVVPKMTELDQSSNKSSTGKQQYQQAQHQQAQHQPRQQQMPTTPVKPTNSNVQSKKAVIESKPVFFVPKVTKFVPASVRSKMSSRPATKGEPSQS